VHILMTLYFYQKLLRLGVGTRCTTHRQNDKLYFMPLVSPPFLSANWRQHVHPVELEKLFKPSKYTENLLVSFKKLGSFLFERLKIGKFLI